jgi:hypothetical protein
MFERVRRADARVVGEGPPGLSAFPPVGRRTSRWRTACGRTAQWSRAFSPHRRLDIVLDARFGALDLLAEPLTELLDTGAEFVAHVFNLFADRSLGRWLRMPPAGRLF